MIRGLVALMNKDDWRGLKRALETLASQKDLEICRDFHILIMDGGSKDKSREVVNSFSMLYPCITFKVQDILGGVGPARVEVVRYAINNGYDFIVWGDSGNKYSPHYLSNLLIPAMGEGCDVVSGFTVVKDESLWSKLLFWYHVYHQLFSFVGSHHAPGNNKLVKLSTYEKVMYIPTSRSDDFFFSLLAGKKGIKFCHSREAVIEVSMPTSFRDVLVWEENRVKGLIEGFYMLGKGFPPILPLWIAYSFAPALFTGLIYLLIIGTSPYLLVLLSILTVIYILGMGLVGIKLGSLSKLVYEKPFHLQGVVALIGMYIHAVLTTYYTLKYLILLKRRSRELMNKVRRVLETFGFSESFYFSA